MGRRHREVGATTDNGCPFGRADHHPVAGCPLPNGIRPGSLYLNRLADAVKGEYDPYAENEWPVAEEMADWGVITLDGQITDLGREVLRDRGWLS